MNTCASWLEELTIPAESSAIAKLGDVSQPNHLLQNLLEESIAGYGGQAYKNPSDRQTVDQKTGPLAQQGWQKPSRLDLSIENIIYLPTGTELPAYNMTAHHICD
jgi:hypothetical protein